MTQSHDMPRILDALDHQLPDSISDTLAAYRTFSATESGLDAKAFRDHHQACRAALGHLDTLIKLWRWAAATRGEASGGEGGWSANAIAAMVADAERELTQAGGSDDTDSPGHADDL